MPRPENLNLGIELNDRDIRVALVDIEGDTPSVRATRTALLPDGAIEGGVIHDPAIVAQTIQQLVRPLRVGPTTRTVVGIPSTLLTTRLLSIPPCEDREVAALVEGEMEHLGILTEEGPLEVITYPRREGAPANAMRSATVFMADHRIVREVKAAVEAAGLRVAGIETSQVGKLRTATLALPRSAATLFIVVGPHLTGLNYFNGADPVANRRVEVGSATLFREQAADADGNPAPLRIDHATLDRLAIESLQLMEFVQRDFADEIESVRIYAVEPEVEMLAPMLERRFGIPTVFSPSPTGLDDPRYAVAYGLAVRDFVGPYKVPKIDLSAKLRKQSDAQETRQNLIGSMLASGLALAVGLVAFVCYGRLNAALDAHGRRTAAQLKELRSQTDTISAARTDQDRLYHALRHEGLPLVAIMDDVARGVDPGVRLKSVGVGKDLHVKVQGEAQNEAALSRIAQRLQASPVLADIGLVQLDRSRVPDSAPITFEIDATTVPADRIDAPGRSAPIGQIASIGRAVRETGS